MNEEYTLTLTADTLTLNLRQLRKAGATESPKPVPIVTITLSKTIPLLLLRIITRELADEKLSLHEPDKPVVLSRGLGRRLTIVMLVLQPIKQSYRFETLAFGLHEMADEEISYWLGRLGRYDADDLGGRFRVLRALRYLLEA